MLSQLGSDLGGILLISINQVGAEGAIGFLSFVVLVSVIWSPWNLPSSLLSGSPVVEGGFHFGVNLPT